MFYLLKTKDDCKLNYCSLVANSWIAILKELKKRFKFDKFEEISVVPMALQASQLNGICRQVWWKHSRI
jgi:hypothetical protein